MEITKEEYNELIINREMKKKLKKWYDSIEIPSDDRVAPLFRDVKHRIREILGDPEEKQDSSEEILGE